MHAARRSKEEVPLFPQLFQDEFRAPRFKPCLRPRGTRRKESCGLGLSVLSRHFAQSSDSLPVSSLLCVECWEAPWLGLLPVLPPPSTKTLGSSCSIHNRAIRSVRAAQCPCLPTLPQLGSPESLE